MTEFRNPQAIVTANWLAGQLGDPDLRVFDCTTHLVLNDGPGAPYTVVSGQADYEQGHIPGSAYLDLQGAFSDTGSRFRFTLPDPDTLAAGFAARGIGDDSRVVLYSRTALPWATRFWWMLRGLGFDNAAILDGGYAGWTEAGHPTATGVETYPAATLTARPRPGLFVGRQAVSDAIGDSGTVTVNALTRDTHVGDNARYGRRGRIPGSCNVPAPDLVHPGTQFLRPAAEIDRIFADAGLDRQRKTITYCGGGIFATLDAFLLHQLGYPDIAVYDNSMSEWANDDSLPMETG